MLVSLMCMGVVLRNTLGGWDYVAMFLLARNSADCFKVRIEFLCCEAQLPADRVG